MYNKCMKTCTRCHNEFEPKGNHTKRCPACRATCVVCGKHMSRGSNICDICFYQSKHKKNYPAVCQSCGQSFICGQPKRMLCDKCRTKTCPICGVNFIMKISQTSNIYCSMKCYQAEHAAPTRTCSFCGADFKQRGGHPETKHCSRKCRYEAAKVPDSEKHRGYKYKKWVTAVFERDNFTCQQCGAAGAIHAHHIKEWNTHKELRYEIFNGVTLCQGCHRKEHDHVFIGKTKFCHRGYAPSRSPGTSQTHPSRINHPF